VIKIKEVEMNQIKKKKMQLPELVQAKLDTDGLSLRKAGEQAGVAHTTIQRIVANESVDLSTVEKICKWLGVSVSEVLDIKSDEASAAEDVLLLFALNNEFAQVFTKLSQKIKSSKLDPSILGEITAFTTFRMDQQLAELRKQESQTAAETEGLLNSDNNYLG
jgi:DNA-binding Xre family transcriptional regulator